MSLFLQRVEEGQDLGSVEVGEAQAGRRFSEALLAEA
jgi:hypothetical protein